MFDLEDSVSALEKGQARRNWSSLSDSSVRTGTCVRMNALASVWGVEDLSTLLSAKVEPELIFMPKAESPATISLLGDILEDARVKTRIVALIETPIGVGNAMAIASASPKLAALAFGAADYSLALGTEMGWELMLPARTTIVMAAKAVGLAVIDSPTFDLQNDLQLEEDCQRAKAMGFTAKFAVHPRQVDTINAHFRPDEAAIEWAAKVMDATSTCRTNITTLDGMMIGPPFVKRAQLILAAKELDR